MRSHFEGLIDKKPITYGSNNFELYFEHDDPEEIAGRLKDKQVRFIHEVREQPWRQKVVRFYDPDGHIIEIGESMEHLCFRLYQEGETINEIAEITYLPAAVIEQAIKIYES